MKANELRIGNWVYETYWNGVEQVSQAVQLARIEPPFDDCTPIPLTPEILEKAGLVAKNCEDSSEHYHFNLPNSEVSFFVCCSKDGIKYGNDGYMLVLVNGIAISRIPCEYVHQLQNLIHALTGEELDINL